MGIIFVMQALIAAGIDLDARNNSWPTILHSVINGEQGILKYLLGQKEGRKLIDVVDNVGHVPLYCTVLLCEREAAEQLVEYSANNMVCPRFEFAQSQHVNFFCYTLINTGEGQCNE